MTLKIGFARMAMLGLVAFGLAGCASHYDRRTGNTLMGAGLGAAGGAIFSGGNPLYTLGGAAAGGLLGNILTQDRQYRRSGNYEGRRDYRPSRSHNRSRNDRSSHDRRGRHRR